MLTAITLYTFSVALHTIFVVVMLGSTFAFPFIAAASRANPQHAGFALGVMREVQEKLVIPGSFLILATGLYQVSEGPYKFEQVWLGVSFAWFLLLLATSLFVAYPTVKKAQAEVAKMQAADPPSGPTPEFLKATGLMAKIGPAMGFSTIGITFLMEAKPF